MTRLAMTRLAMTTLAMTTLETKVGIFPDVHFIRQARIGQVSVRYAAFD